MTIEEKIQPDPAPPFLKLPIRHGRDDHSPQCAGSFRSTVGQRGPRYEGASCRLWSRFDGAFEERRLMEIERNFLVKKLPRGLRRRPRLLISQGYLAAGNQGREVRLRRKGNQLV